MLELLRHGDTGCSGFRGRLDDPLSPLGWQQMREATTSRPWSAIVSSPLRRCAEFAFELGARHGISVRLDARLAEYDFGDWTGATPAELAARSPETLTRFWEDPERWPPPAAESLAAFEARIVAALCEHAPLHREGELLVITHGGVIRLLRCREQGLSLREMSAIDVPHAGLHRLHWPPPRAALTT